MSRDLFSSKLGKIPPKETKSRDDGNYNFHVQVIAKYLRHFFKNARLTP